MADREGAVWALGRITDGSDAVVTVFTNCLTDPDVLVRLGALDGLQRLGASATDAVPAITRALKDSRVDVRACAASALGHIGGATNVVQAALLESLRDPEDSVRLCAAEALAVSASDLRPVVMALADLINRGGMAPEAASALGRLHTEPPLSVAALTRGLTKVEGVRLVPVIQALGAFGTNSAPAVPKLLELSKNRNEVVRGAVISSLEKIDPSAAAKAGSIQQF